MRLIDLFSIHCDAKYNSLKWSKNEYKIKTYPPPLDFFAFPCKEKNMAWSNDNDFSSTRFESETQTQRNKSSSTYYCHFQSEMANFLSKHKALDKLLEGNMDY